MNTKILIGGLAVSALVIAILASGFGHDVQKIQSPLIGRVAPPFTLNRVDGKGTITLDTLRGRPAIVNFWATWCEPCQMEHHVLQSAYDRFGSGVQFVGIVYDDEPARITDFLDKWGARYPTLVDKDGKTAIAYGVSGVPETFFIDATGRIVAKYEGPISPDEIAEYIRQIGGNV